MSDPASTLFLEASELSAAGDVIAARTKLREASNLGHAEAAYRLAISESAGIGGPVDKVTALKRLADISSTFPPARILQSVALASGWSGSEDWSKAIAVIGQAANEGDPAALFDIAMLCLLRDSSALLEQAELCLIEALKGGAHYAAPALMRLSAAKGEAFVPPPQLLRALEGARYVPIGELLKLAEAQPKTAVAPRNSPDLPGILAWLQTQPETWIPQTSSLLAPEINARTYNSAIHPCICDFMIGNAGHMLSQAEVFDPISGSVTKHPSRQALQAGLQPYMQTLVGHAFERFLCKLVDQPWQHAERLTILLYRPGDYYGPHADYFHEGSKEDIADIEASGQRAATALVCLSPASGGGATYFPHLKASWTGKLGDVLTWENLNPDEQPNPLSWHEGQKVTDGWKSLASLWVRTKPYRGPVLKPPTQTA